MGLIPSFTYGNCMATKYDPETTPVLIRGYAREGNTKAQIAQRLHICRQTLDTWAASHLDVLDALKEGSEIPDIQVETALLDAAKGGNVIACIYWLKNRKPAKWRDKPPEVPEEFVEALERFADRLLAGARQVVSEPEPEEPDAE